MVQALDRRVIVTKVRRRRALVQGPGGRALHMLLTFAITLGPRGPLSRREEVAAIPTERETAKKERKTTPSSLLLNLRLFSCWSWPCDRLLILFLLVFKSLSQPLAKDQPIDGYSISFSTIFSFNRSCAVETVDGQRIK